jgi:hypothetical protein
MAGETALRGRLVDERAGERFLLVTRETGFVAGGLQEMGVVRRVRSVAGGALPLRHWRVHVRQLESRLFLFVAGETEARLRLLEDERSDDSMTLVARLTVSRPSRVDGHLRELLFDGSVAGVHSFDWTRSAADAAGKEQSSTGTSDPAAPVREMRTDPPSGRGDGRSTAHLSLLSMRL